MAENPSSKALAAGKSRRRTAGESAGGPGRDLDSAPTTQHTGEKRIAVDLPSQLYTDAKILAAHRGTTAKEIITSALAKEIAARRGQR